MLWYAWLSLSRERDASVARQIPQSNAVDLEDSNIGADFTMVDFEQAVPEVSNFASPPAILVDQPNPTSIEEVGGKSSRQLRLILRRKEDNKRKKAAKAYGPRPDDPSRIFDCEFCLGKFDRGGLIKHL
jgi:hypothetical protein